MIGGVQGYLQQNFAKKVQNVSTENRLLSLEKLKIFNSWGKGCTPSIHITLPNSTIPSADIKVDCMFAQAIRILFEWDVLSQYPVRISLSISLVAQTLLYFLCQTNLIKLLSQEYQILFHSKLFRYTIQHHFISFYVYIQTAKIVHYQKQGIQVNSIAIVLLELFMTRNCFNVSNRKQFRCRSKRSLLNLIVR